MHTYSAKYPLQQGTPFSQAKCHEFARKTLLVQKTQNSNNNQNNSMAFLHNSRLKFH